MKKQLFIVALTVLAIPSVVFAPASGGGGSYAPARNVPTTTLTTTGGIISTPASAVANNPSNLGDVVAGALDAAGVQPSTNPNKSGAAYQAGYTAVTGQAFPASLGAQSKALGRLGSRK